MLSGQAVRHQSLTNDVYYKAGMLELIIQALHVWGLQWKNLKRIKWMQYLDSVEDAGAFGAFRGFF